MRRSFSSALTALIILLFTSVPAVAQTFESVGTRAAGMGGAFVAVADDAIAVIGTRPDSCSAGSYFSLVLDNNEGQAEPDDISQAGQPIGEHHRVQHAAARRCRTTGSASTHG